MSRLDLFDGHFALVDAADYEAAKEHRWHRVRCSQGPENYYAATSIRNGEKRTTLYLHRYIVDAKPGVLVDHKNGDGLDCRRENLRETDRSGNLINRANPNRSGYRGVYRNGASWRVIISVNGRAHNVGAFRSIDAAARAYDAEARRLHGVFAILNFPEQADEDFSADRLRGLTSSQLVHARDSITAILDEREHGADGARRPFRRTRPGGMQ